MRKRVALLCGAAAVFGVAAGGLSAGPITYTDTQGDSLGSTNGGRDIVAATVSNDLTNLYITLELNPTTTTNASGTETPANIATSGYNYAIGLTTGAGAGGDYYHYTSGTDLGNPYGRSISFDSSLGGMTDFIGIYGAGGSGTVASPYTSYAFNDYVFGTPSDTTTTANAWTKINVGTTGQPISATGGDANDNTISLTIPLSDFAANLTFTPGNTIYLDMFTTGSSGNQTAYDSLADQSPTQTPASYSATAQYNALTLDSYVIQVPEPASIGVLGCGALLLGRRRSRQNKN